MFHVIKQLYKNINEHKNLIKIETKNLEEKFLIKFFLKQISWSYFNIYRHFSAT